MLSFSCMKQPTAPSVIEALQLLANPHKIPILSSFFKTGPGQYGDGDIFLGVTVPDQRKIAGGFYKELPEDELSTLIKSPYHEARLTAVLINVLKFEKAREESERKRWVDFYLQHREWVNNWDLVDSSAHKILGPWLEDKDRTLLHELAASANLWEVRIGILSTFHFIRLHDFDDTLRMITHLLEHPHDLIHKACGWMLREVGNRDAGNAMRFLMQHYRKMPRTMLRYAIEKLDPTIRKQFLEGTI